MRVGSITSLYSIVVYKKIKGCQLKRKIYIVYSVYQTHMVKETTIKLSADFKRWLDSVGRKGDTYEDIIKSIILYVP